MNGRTTSKEQERQIVSTGGKRSVVKTGGQVSADAIKKRPTRTRDGTATGFGPYVAIKMDRKKSTRINSSRHGPSKAVIHASMLSGQNLHALSVVLGLPNRGKLRRQNLWVLI